MTLGLFDVNLREFDEAIKLREKTCSKTLTEIQNRALRNVAYRSAEFTEITAAAQVSADLKAPGLLAKITAIRLRGVKVKDFAAEMEKTRQMRLRSIRYLRSGFAPIIRALGGKFRGGRSAKAEEGFRSAQSGIHSTSKLSSGGSQPAEFTWIIDEPTGEKAGSAEKKVSPAIQQAVDFVARDMINHAIEKMNKALA